MAKRKSSREMQKKESGYAKELLGVLLVASGLIGFGSYGLVGRIIKNFAIFLCGTWYAAALFAACFLGVYLFIKRKSPDYGYSRLIGVYIIIISVLLLSHLAYVKDNNLSGIDIMKVTIDNVMAAVDNFDLIGNTGGGVFGAFFSWLFVSLFDMSGTIIVVVILILFGIVMLFDITISDVIDFIISPFRKLRIKKHSNAKIVLPVDTDDSENDDSKVIISSVDELTSNSVKISPGVDENNSEEVIKPVIDENAPYVLPPITLLDEPKRQKNAYSAEYIANNNKILEKVFKDFGIVGRVVEVHVGPSVTQYEVELQSGTKVNKVLSINREIALALAAKDVRIQAPIPGKSTIGIEMPNQIPAAVGMREVLSGISKKLDSCKLIAPLGKDIYGTIQYYDISKAPHILVAGSTGSGKSVCINNIIMSILMRTKPEEVKMILVDPKKVELTNYDGVPHLLMPVVTDPKKASVALQKMVQEMQKRYDAFKESGTKNITSYNEYVDKYNARHTDKLERMGYILVIIDELADLMLVAAKEVEESILRLTQLARAAGIHLIVATQRPSTDIITGLLKANIPSRIAFAVASSIDSRTILDMTGAEKLLGRGDMLFLPLGENTPRRIQGSFVSDEEIGRVVDFVKKQRTATYDESAINLDANFKMDDSSAGDVADDDSDPLYNEVVEFAVKTGKISASLIQRKFRLGYNRAARIIDILEEKKIIGPQNGSKPRDVLVKLDTNAK